MTRSRIESQTRRSHAAETSAMASVGGKVSDVPLWRIAAISVMLLLTASLCSAQSTTGSIYGQVTDTTHAMLQGAQITAVG